MPGRSTSPTRPSTSGRKPELEITDPYEITQEQFDAAGR